MPEDHEAGESPCPPTFEDALQRLEGIVHDLEDGDVGLAEALARYEEGVALLKQCYGLLEHAQRRIELLRGVDDQGRAVTEPFDDTASLSEEEMGDPAAGRPRAGRGREGARRPSRPSPGGEEGEMDAPRSLF